MAGELNGTKVLIQKNGSAIVGQMETTVTFNGVPIDTTNKSDSDWTTLLDGELSGKQWVFSGTLVYNDDTVYRAVRADAVSGTQDTYQIVYGSTGEQLEGSFLPHGMSDSLPMGDKVTTAITFSSSGAVTRTAAS